MSKVSDRWTRVYQMALSEIRRAVTSCCGEDAWERFETRHLKFPTRPDAPTLYRKMCFNSLNRQGFFRSVNSVVADWDRLAGVLCDFDVRRVADRFPQGDHQELRCSLEGSGFFDRQRLAEWDEKHTTNRTLKNDPPLTVFLKACIGCSHFLARTELRECDKLEEGIRQAHTIKEGDCKYGLTLAFDFMKENGLFNCVKPDLRMVALLKGVENIQHPPEEVVRHFDSVCCEIGMSPYRFDKVLWMASSGRVGIADIENWQGKLACLLNGRPHSGVSR
jgi:hypothetical protein